MNMMEKRQEKLKDLNKNGIRRIKIFISPFFTANSAVAFSVQSILEKKKTTRIWGFGHG